MQVAEDEPVPETVAVTGTEAESEAVSETEPATEAVSEAEAESVAVSVPVAHEDGEGGSYAST